jgi:hypothetical protein
MTNRRPLHLLVAGVGLALAAALPALQGGIAAAGTPDGHTASQTQTVTQAPGGVTYQAGGAVSSPTADPADLISASATDDGTTLSLSAKTVALNDPATDPNWRNNTYIGWAINPSGRGAPDYYAYFQLNPDGSYDGELTYAATDTPVSCTVSLAFDTTNGYQASVPAACLPGVTNFSWYAYSLYDTVPLAQDPKGGDGFGRAIPDPNTNGGTVYALPVTAPAQAVPTTAPGISPGYLLFARDGGVFAFGGAGYFGSLGGQHLNEPVVGGTATLDGKGYWMVASDGGVFGFGDARYYGSMGGQHLNAPVVAIVPLPTGTGYFLVASDGGVFAFGGARAYGSMGGKHLNKPIVGATSTASGLGYWLVASDGGIFSFGDAAFKGSEGGTVLNQPVVNMTRSAGGYLLAAADGGVFAFGGAQFYGSTGQLHLTEPVEGIALTGDGLGYRMVSSDGGIFSFGSAPFFGSEGGQPLNQPIVGMASEG